MQMTMPRIVYGLGVFCMLLCIADALLFRFARINVTGLTWTPILLGGLGIVLMQVSRFVPAPPQDQGD